MPLEDLVGPSIFLNALVRTNPDGDVDKLLHADDHLRGVKNALLNTFPNLTGTVTATQAQLNRTATATSAATANQLILRDANGRAKIAAPSAVDDIARLGNVTEHTSLTGSQVHGLGDVSTFNVGGDPGEIRTNSMNESVFRLAGTEDTQVRSNLENDGRFLRRSLNFSDLDNAATARINVGLATVSQTEAEAGSGTTTRAWTAQRVWQAITAAFPTKFLAELNTYLAARERRMTLGGDFTGTDNLIVTRIGRLVTITSHSTSSVSHTSGTSASSSLFFLPGWARPSHGMVHNTYYSGPAAICTVAVDSSGTLTVFYIDHSGAQIARTTTLTNFTLSFTTLAN
jgi:hypothetical protein